MGFNNNRHALDPLDGLYCDLPTLGGRGRGAVVCAYVGASVVHGQYERGVGF